MLIPRLAGTSEMEGMKETRKQPGKTRRDPDSWGCFDERRQKMKRKHVSRHPLRFETMQKKSRLRLTKTMMWKKMRRMWRRIGDQGRKRTWKERRAWKEKEVRPKDVLVEAFRLGLDVRVLLPCS